MGLNFGIHGKRFTQTWNVNRRGKPQGHGSFRCGHFLCFK
jgi:hypothetical protein